MNRTSYLLCFLLTGIFTELHAQSGNPLFSDSNWSAHFQATGIIQAHPSFTSPYSGQNSLDPNAERAFSVTSTLYIGRRLWKGASIYFNPEMAGGKGIGSTLGIAGFPNGETFRIGNPEPVVYIARLFISQNFNLDKDHIEYITDDANQITDRLSTSRLTISLGKFGVADFFDNNGVSHDPRTDFMNWAFMNNGAYDYAANTRGYTYGLVAELIKPGWALRFGTALMPTYANGPSLDIHYLKTNSETIEYERDFQIHQRKGAVRLLGYFNTSKAPNYDQVVHDKITGVDTSMDVIYGKEYGGKKFGLGINVEQELSPSTGFFMRIGWNDGKTATWAFSEIDNTVSAGIKINGKGWKRSGDNIGVAILTNGISSGHRNFLNAGGYGFMIGDGKLPKYSRENIGEVFYQLYIFDHVWVSGDYQFVLHPAYNQDRGPVHVFAARVHVEW